MLLLVKKYTDTLVEQTNFKPKEALEFEINKQNETFSLNPRTNLFEEGRRLSTVT